MKATFRFDIKIMVEGTVSLDNATDYLNCAGVCYAIEPWPEDHYAIYLWAEHSRQAEIIKSTWGLKEEG